VIHYVMGISLVLLACILIEYVWLVYTFFNFVVAVIFFSFYFLFIFLKLN
jgi:hypothetical protein